MQFRQPKLLQLQLEELEQVLLQSQEDEVQPQLVVVALHEQPQPQWRRRRHLRTVATGKFSFLWGALARLQGFVASYAPRERKVPRGHWGRDHPQSFQDNAAEKFVKNFCFPQSSFRRQTRRLAGTEKRRPSFRGGAIDFMECFTSCRRGHSWRRRDNRRPPCPCRRRSSRRGGKSCPWARYAWPPGCAAWSRR